MQTMVLIVVVAATSRAWAQTPGSEPGLVLILGPPALISVAMDVVLLSTLIPTGTTGRGRAITNIALSGVGIVFSVLCLVLGLTTGGSTTTWTAMSAASLAIETGSLVLSIYGLTRSAASEPPPEEEREREPESAPDPVLLNPAPSREPVPQLFMLPLRVSL
jgi:hypothetical protein